MKQMAFRDVRLNNRNKILVRKIFIKEKNNDL